VPKRVDHDERRRLIVRALWRITERGGLGAVSFREVAAEAGVSVRLVQYYFGTKAELLREANRQALQTMGARIAERALAAMDGDPSPRTVVATIAREFLPTDDESRRAMLLYYAFYTAQMTDASLRGAGEVPRGFIDLVADQLRRGQREGSVAPQVQPELEAAVLLAVIPAAASGVLAGYGTVGEARALVEYAIDRMFSGDRASGATGSA
jgi:AcrR family transcriptional regulator